MSTSKPCARQKTRGVFTFCFRHTSAHTFFTTQELYHHLNCLSLFICICKHTHTSHSTWQLTFITSSLYRLAGTTKLLYCCCLTDNGQYFKRKGLYTVCLSVNDRRTLICLKTRILCKRLRKYQWNQKEKSKIYFHNLLPDYINTSAHALHTFTQNPAHSFLSHQLSNETETEL